VSGPLEVVQTVVAPAAGWWGERTAAFEESCDVVVVGSGPGGAFAALTLAEAGLDVIVVEEGFHHPNATFSPDVSDTVEHLFQEGGLRTAVGRPPIPVASGKALGGGTVVNSAISFRTPESVLAEWNDVSGGAFADTEHYYRTMDAVEAMVQVGVTPDRLLSGYCRVHREAANGLGWSNHNFRRNTPRCAGCGRCNNGCPVHGKASVDVAVLPRAARAGCRVITGASVRHVESGKIQGVVVGRDRSERGNFVVNASKAVVLSAGAISSPRLLLDSGAVADGGEVGAGLLVHPVFSVCAYFRDLVVAAPGSSQGHYIDEFGDDRMLFESNPTIPGALFPAMPWWGKEAWEYLSRGSNWGSTGVMIRDENPGRVVGNPGGAGVKIHYDIGEVDRQRAILGMTRAAELWLEGAGATCVTLNVYGAPACHTVAEAVDVLKDVPMGRLIGYSSHPQASCSVGRACGLDGEVIGAKGIHVIDASSLPLNVGRNPQISVMTTARVLAERLATKLGASPKPLWLGGELFSVPQAGTPCGLKLPEPAIPATP